MKKILRALDGASSKPVESSDDIKRSLEILNEAANPHKVSLPVQMAMQHYQQPVAESIPKQSIFKTYIQETEEDIAAQRAIEEQRISMYSRKIANKVLMKEGRHRGDNDFPDYDRAAGQKDYRLNPLKVHDKASHLLHQPDIDIGKKWWTDDPDAVKAGKELDRMKRSWSPINRNYSLKYKDHDDWDLDENLNAPDVIKLDVPLLIRLLEYAREDAKTDMDLHNVTEMLIQLSEEGNTLTMDQYDQIVGDQKMLPPPTNESCWKGYKQLGMKKKGKKTVPNCIPKKGN